MSDILIYEGDKVSHLKSVHSQDYLSKRENEETGEVDYFSPDHVIFNPNQQHLEKFESIGPENLKIVEGFLVELTADEKKAKKDKEKDEKVRQAENFQAEFESIFMAFIEVINKRFSSNKITKAELIEEIRKGVK